MNRHYNQISEDNSLNQSEIEFEPDKSDIEKETISTDKTVRKFKPELQQVDEKMQELNTKELFLDNENQHIKVNETKSLGLHANTQELSEKTDEEHYIDPDITEPEKQMEKPYILDINALTYELEKFSRNRMIIFNHEYFSDDTRREGTAIDKTTLKETFEQFRFVVETHDDLMKTEVLAKLETFGKQDFSDCGCICVAILSHGADYGNLKAFDAWYSERDVFACFNTLDNETLVAKPIIFLIQACRGPNLASSVPVSQSDPRPKIELDHVIDKEGGYFLPTESDIIIFHSCFFGRASARDWTNGTWFIQTICDQIKLYADTEHLEKINRRVRSIIALDKQFNHAKQMPVTASTLLRKLFLIKKKEDLEVDH